MFQYRLQDFLSVEHPVASRPHVAILLEIIGARHPHLLPALEKYYDGILKAPVASNENGSGNGHGNGNGHAPVHNLAPLKEEYLKSQQRDIALENDVHAIYRELKNDLPLLMELTRYAAIANDIINDIASENAVDNAMQIGRGFIATGDFTSHYVANFVDSLFVLPKSTDESIETRFRGRQARWKFSIHHFFDVLKRIWKHEVVTAHPTKYTTPAYDGMRKLYRIAARALTARVGAHLADPKVEVEEALAAWRMRLEKLVDTPMTALDANSHVAKLRQTDEVITIARSVNNASDHMALAWHTYDRALKRHFEGIYDNAMRMEWNLNFRMGSWGLDKDGHDGKHVELTLFEQALHRHIRTAKVGLRLQELAANGVPIEEKTLKEFVARLGAAETRLKGIYGMLDQAADKETGDIQLSQTRHDAISRDIQSALALAGEKDPKSYAEVRDELLAGLRAAFKKAPEKTHDAILDLVKDLENFGLSGAYLEARERSNQFREAVRHLFQNNPASKEFDDADTAHFLNQYIQSHPLGLHSRLNSFLAPIDDTSDYRVYGKDRTKVIAYHHFKRVQEVIRSGDMRGGLIIAECKGVGSMMEGVASVLAVSPIAPGQKPGPQIPVIGLYENLETLTRAPETTVALFDYKSWRQHAVALAMQSEAYLKHGVLQLDIEVMIAHSDNTKNSGTYASRAANHHAHHETVKRVDEQYEHLKALLESDGVDTTKLVVKVQYHEGKSDRHFNRFGTRTHTAFVDAVGTHEFNKGTRQGADATGFYGSSVHSKREWTTHYRNAVREVDIKDKTRRHERKPMLIRDAVISAYLRTYEDYRNPHYTDGGEGEVNYFGTLAAHPGVDFRARMKTAMGSRPEKKDAKNEGDISYMHEVKGTTPVPTSDVRAIPYSEVQFNMYTQATWFGSRKVEGYLYDSFFGSEDGTVKPNKEARDEFEMAANDLHNEAVDHLLFDHKNRKLTTFGTNALYRLEDVHCEVMDLVLFGVANTAFDKLQRLFETGKNDYGIGVDPVILEYREKLFEDFFAAVDIGLKSRGIEPPGRKNLAAQFGGDELAAAGFCSYMVRKWAIPKASDEIEMKKALTTLPMKISEHLLMEGFAQGKPIRNAPSEDIRKRIMRECQAGQQEWSHGWSSASDPVLKYCMDLWKSDNSPQPKGLPTALRPWFDANAAMAGGPH